MSTISDFLMVTTPYLPGYKVKKVLGLASGSLRGPGVLAGSSSQGFSPWQAER